MSWNKNTHIESLEGFSQRYRVLRSRVFAEVTDFGLAAAYGDDEKIKLHVVEATSLATGETGIWAQRRVQNPDCDSDDFVSFVKVDNISNPFVYDYEEYDVDIHGDSRPKPHAMILSL